MPSLCTHADDVRYARLEAVLDGARDHLDEGDESIDAHARTRVGRIAPGPPTVTVLVELPIVTRFNLVLVQHGWVDANAVRGARLSHPF